VLTGEHGVGVEKRDLMGDACSPRPTSPSSMRVKCAFDPDHCCSTPARCFPKLRRCAELGRLVVTQNKIPFPDIPRF
jgi:glycolate oxidase